MNRPRTEPVDAATAAELRATLRGLLATDVGRKRHLGVQLAVQVGGAELLRIEAGWLDRARRRAVRTDSVFSVFSATKGIAALAVWTLVDAGRLELEAPVPDVWPGFRTRLSVAEMLSHQGGLHRVPDDLDQASLADLDFGVEWVGSLPAAWPPGTDSGYHTITFGWLVEGLVRAVTGASTAELVRVALAEPLGLADELGLGLPPSWDERAAEVVELAEARGLPWLDDELVGHPALEAMPRSFVPDWNDDALRRSGHPAFGAWASARALAALYAGAGTVLSATTASCLAQPRFEGVDRCLGVPLRRGVGFDLGGPDPDGTVGTIGPRPTAFGHGGHGGQVAFADPDVRLAVGMTANLLAAVDVVEDRTTPVCELVRAYLGCAV